MALLVLQPFLFLSILMLCQSSFMSDESSASSTPSPASSAGQHPRHPHHHRHHHGEGQQTGRGTSDREEDVGDEDTALGRLLSQKGVQAERAEEEEHGAQHQVRENAPAGDGRTSTTVVSMTTQPAAPLVGASVRAGDESRGGPDHADLPPQSSGLREQDTGRPEQRPDGFQPTTMPSSARTESTSDTSTPSLESQRTKVTDQQDGLQPVTDHTRPDTTTPPNGRGLSTPPRNDDDDDAKDVTSQDSGSQETPAESSDEKLVNRPRWRHALRRNGEEDNGDESSTNHGHLRIKDNSSKNRSKDIQSLLSEPVAESDPSSDQLSAPQSGSPPVPGPGPRQWANNRPRWEVSRQTPAEHPEPSGLPMLVKLKGNGNRDAKRTKNGMQKEKAMNQPKARKKEKKEEAAEVVQEGKMRRKWRSKKKNKQLPKGCPGCSPTEIKLAEARELHKQVLKAQLLDKLRLVPTFHRQPWPPKLPEQVFPEEAQRDQGLYEERYYASPTQLLLFGRDLGPRHRLKKAGTGSYKFGVRGKVKGGVRWARLWVYKMKDANDLHGQTLVVTQLHMTKRRRLRELSLVARLDTHVQEGWVSFDVTHLVQRWVVSGSPSSLQVLAIRCKTCQRTNYRAIFGVKSHFRPVLEIRESGERQRHRGERSLCDPTNGCCKFDMTVTFEELGIHEIFRPLALKADYCFGTCERPDAYHYNHTMIVQHMRFNSHVHNSTLRQLLQPCCVPVVLREATIYHYLNSGLDSQVSLVPNLLVDRCGCA